MAAWRRCGALGGPDRSLHRPATSPCLPPHFQPLPSLVPNSHGLPVGLGSAGKWACCARCPLWGTWLWALSALLECVDISVPVPALLLPPRPPGLHKFSFLCGWLCWSRARFRGSRLHTVFLAVSLTLFFSVSLFWGEEPHNAVLRFVNAQRTQGAGNPIAVTPTPLVCALQPEACGHHIPDAGLPCCTVLPLL